MDNFIPVNRPVFNGNEKKYLLECIDTGWISSEGPFIQRFEENIAALTQRKYGIAVNSGTSALETALQALALEKGSEVILPTFTIISCAQAIIKAGLIPVVVDCCSDTWNMNVNLIEEKITPKTKAIMAVHIYGITVDMDPILELADRYCLKVIEDAAEVHGQTYKGKPCGCFGDISIFSFYPNKHITCGEGGMILTDNKILEERCRSIRNLCFQPSRRFIHEELGNNFRMTNMQAAVGVAQLERLDETVRRKREIGHYYWNLLKDLKTISLPINSTEYCKNIYWVYGLVIDELSPFDAIYIMKKLKEMNIGTRPFFYPIHKQPVFLKMGLFKNESYPNAERIADKGFYIPSGIGIKKEEQEIVSDAIHSIFL